MQINVLQIGASGTPVELPTAFLSEFRGWPAKMSSLTQAVLVHPLASRILLKADLNARWSSGLPRAMYETALGS